MAKSGILGQAKPNGSAVLYRAPIDSAASAVLTVANDGTGSAYSVGVKDYDQQLTLDASTYLFHRGDIISTKVLDLDITLSAGDLSAGDIIQSTDLEKTAKFHSFFVPTLTTIYVKSVTVHALTLTGATGTFSPGDTITVGTSPDDTTAIVYDSYASGVDLIVVIGPETVNGAGANIVDSDIVTSNSGGSGTVAVGGIGADITSFAFSTTTAGGVYSTYFNTALSIYNDRTYRFDTSDSSMVGRDFKFSQVINGEWGPDGIFGNGDDGVEYNDAVTTNGTSGNVGAYVQIAFNVEQLPPSNLYFYDGGTGTATNADYGGDDRFFDVTDSIEYDSIYVYDVVGSWVNNVDGFTVADATYNVISQNTGKWAVVKNYSGTTLELTLGLNSASFVSTDTFLDSPRTTEFRSLATVSSVDVNTTDIAAGQYIVNAKTLSANAIDKTTSLVVGPGQTLVVNSATANNSFSLIGFEDAATDITTRIWPN